MKKFSTILSVLATLFIMTTIVNADTGTKLGRVISYHPHNPPLGFNPKMSYLDFDPLDISSLSFKIYAKFNSDGPYFKGSNLTMVLNNDFSTTEIINYWEIKDGTTTLYSGTLIDIEVDYDSISISGTQASVKGAFILYNEELGILKLDMGQWDSTDSGIATPVTLFKPLLVIPGLMTVTSWIIDASATLIAPEVGSEAIPPGISLNGNAETYHWASKPFNDPFAEVNEIIPSASFTSNFTVSAEPKLDGEMLDVGDYTITYTANGLDEALMPADPNTVQRNVHVVSTPVIPTPQSHNFGTQYLDTESKQIFSIKNINDTSVTISDLSITGVDPTQFSFQNATCMGTVLDPSDTCWLYVKFSPTSEGVKTANFEVKVSVSDTSEVFTIPAPLAGTGAIEVPAIGDINFDRKIDLSDAIIALQTTSGQAVNPDDIFTIADTNGDKKIGIEDAVYILQVVSEIKIVD